MIARAIEIVILLYFFPFVVAWHWLNGEVPFRSVPAHTFRAWRRHVWGQL